MSMRTMRAVTVEVKKKARPDLTSVFTRKLTHSPNPRPPS